MRQVLILFISLICYASFAQNVAYNPSLSKGKLYEYAQFAKTKNSSLNIEDILDGKTDLDFIPLTSEHQSVGFSRDDYWLTFNLQNSSELPETYYLQTARSVTNIVNLFQVVNKNDIIEFKSGDAIPFKERQVAHRKSIFKIELSKNSTQKFYLHLRSDGETLNLPLILNSENQFWKSNYSEQLFLGFFYGLLFLAIVVYLFFFTSLSNKTFL